MERCGMSSSYPWSVDFGAGELDHLGPLLCICADECAEVCGRACKHRVAEVGDTRLHPGIGEARIDLLVELVDDLGGWIPWGANPLPPGSPLAPPKDAYPPNVLQHFPARRSRPRPRAPFARPRV